MTIFNIEGLHKQDGGLAIEVCYTCTLKNNNGKLLHDMNINDVLRISLHHGYSVIHNRGKTDYYKKPLFQGF